MDHERAGYVTKTACLVFDYVLEAALAEAVNKYIFPFFLVYKPKEGGGGVELSLVSVYAAVLSIKEEGLKEAGEGGKEAPESPTDAGGEASKALMHSLL